MIACDVTLSSDFGSVMTLLAFRQDEHAGASEYILAWSQCKESFPMVLAARFQLELLSGDTSGITRKNAGEHAENFVARICTVDEE